MKSSYKMAAFALTFALAFTACGDSTSASDNGNGEGGSTPCSEGIQGQCPATLEEGTICDIRDGKIYKVATFGTQTWMIQNLNYYACSVKSESWCYDDDDANCEQYGRLYSWPGAMGLGMEYRNNYANVQGVQRGNCPSGFHIPSDAETDILIEYFDANGGEVAFNLTLSGEKTSTSFAELGRKAYFWTADEDHSQFGGPRNALIWSYSDTFGFGGGSLMKDGGLSVRCVKD